MPTIGLTGTTGIGITKQIAADRRGRGYHRIGCGAIRIEPGNLCLRKTAWWGWEDSNLQPNGHEQLALIAVGIGKADSR